MVNPIDAFDKVWAAASKLKELSDKLKEADIRMAIADLMMNAAELKLKIAELTEENLSLKFQLGQARQGEDIKNKLKHRDNSYFLPQDGGGIDDGPFCTRCFDSEEKLIRKTVGDYAMGFKSHCPNCKQYFK